MADAALLPPGPRAGSASPPRSAGDSCRAQPGPFSSCKQLLPPPHASRICRAVDSSAEGPRQPADTLTPLLPALEAFWPLLHHAGASSSQQQQGGSLLPAAFTSPAPQSLPQRSPALQLRFPHAACARRDQQPQQVGHIPPTQRGAQPSAASASSDPAEGTARWKQLLQGRVEKVVFPPPPRGSQHIPG